VRALLRLVRPGLPDEVYTQENRTLRDAARSLSELRDAAVLVDTHDAVVEAGGTPVDGVRDELVQRHLELSIEVLDAGVLPEVRERLAAVLARIDTWPLATVDWDVLGAGLKRVYRRGRNAMAAAYDDPTAERFHEWRNRAKYLRLQLQFLKELWPEVIGGSAKSAHALADVLGDAHDLAVLRATIIERRADAQSGPLVEFIDARRAMLGARARPIGLRLYAEEPSRYVARLGQYWEAGVAATHAA
jgi:CHAD domain-containing protein